MVEFAVAPGGFVRAGRPHQVLSGALHYFRVRPEQWRHRLRMLRAMGLNCVETYVAWNLHEPRPGEFDFTGIADLSRFLTEAAEEGLDAIVRPGPYICAEWENGGLPAWLTGQPGIRVRCLDERYLAAVDAFFDRLIPIVAAHQTTRGGNVLMVQVENEYGSYGSDRAYLEHLADGLRRRGVDVPLFTSDGPEDFMLTGGTLPGVLATVNFGSDPEGAFAALRRHRPDDPLFCMEFWCGWFDHWGARHVTRDPADAADVLRRMVEAGASVNVYMAHGGSNWGTWAGANRADGHLGPLQPDVTSYDYDAPIDERGAATEKFRLFREVLAPYATGPLPAPPPLPPLVRSGTVALTGSLRLFDVLDVVSPGPRTAAMPPTFEDLGLAQGLALYRATLPGPRREYPVTVDGLADRAHVFVDGTLVGVLTETDNVVDVEVPGAVATLDLLVESMGRVNYGPRVGERKGITGAVRHGQQYAHGFTAYPVELGELPPLPWGRAPLADPALPSGGPVFHRGRFDLTEAADAYLAVPNGSRGYVWVNGHLLGRYLAEGPQRTLYVPWPLLRPGHNELLVLDLDAAPVTEVEFRPTPDLG
ncbi:glycoside hydrolase family 35 protein [Catellatospora tritici]|uniref:glycoside hydrolase family 35 protein n=1 Tax=Catellatospora tritici TaxID=2851566 RepID=UPI001C2DEDBF|nr:glycoside hydrolase family 35 protein [Catellatospora tritici]MBV1854196.1 beta-galactosidase [Catellatospora tritici]